MFLARPPKSSMDFWILESKMCSVIYKVKKISHHCFSHGSTTGNGFFRTFHLWILESEHNKSNSDFRIQTPLFTCSEPFLHILNPLFYQKIMGRIIISSHSDFRIQIAYLHSLNPSYAKISCFELLVLNLMFLSMFLN